MKQVVEGASHLTLHFANTDTDTAAAHPSRRFGARAAQKSMYPAAGQGSSSGCFEAWRTRPTTLPSPSGRRITKGLCSYLHKLLPTTTHTTRSTFPLYKTCLSCIHQAHTTTPQTIASRKHKLFSPKIHILLQELRSAMASNSQKDLPTLGRAPSKCVGPEYKDSKDLPTATVSTEIPHDNVHILPQTSQLISLLTYVPSMS